MKNRFSVKKMMIYVGLLMLFNIVFCQTAFAEEVYSSHFDGMPIEKVKTFYYDQLDENEKMLYKKLQQCTWDNYSFSVLKTDLEMETFEEFGEALRLAFAAYESDHPEVLMQFTRTQIVDDIVEKDEEYIVNVPLNKSGSQYKYEKSKNKLSQIASSLDGNDSYKKLIFLWNYFLDNSQYDYATGVGVEVRGKAFSYDHDPYGLLLGYCSVCEGYSIVCKMMCDELDIPCIIVGNAGHAWNYIEMDNGKWYAVDFSANYPRDWYDDAFLMGSKNEIYRNNTSYHLSDLYIEKMGKFMYPILSEDSYQYKTDINVEDYVLILGESSFQDKEIEFLYDVNEDGISCTITDYEGRATSNLIIPDSIDGYQVTQIGEFAFSNSCDIRGTVSLPATVKKIEDMAFMQCKYLETIDIPDSVIELGTGVFMACPNLSSVTLGTEHIPDNIFLKCVKLRSVNLGDNVQYIGNSAFGSCMELSDMELPSGIEEIGEYAFSNSMSLKQINFPDSLSSIGTYAFRNTGLVSVNIKSTVKYIGECAFAECNSLEKITVDDRNENYCSLSGLLFDKNKTSILCVPASVKNVELPDGLEIINESCFANCRYLEKVTISKDVKEIQKLAFFGCENLKEFIVNPDNSCYASMDGVIYTKDLSKLIAFPNAKKDFKLFPTNLNTIGEFAFYSTNILTVDLSKSNITKLEKSAFDDASAMTQIILPEAIETIPEFCFDYCTQLQKIYMGSNVKIIGDSAFEAAGSLSQVYFGGTKEQWDAISMGKNNSNIIQCNKNYNCKAESIEQTPSVDPIPSTQPSTSVNPIPSTQPSTSVNPIPSIQPSPSSSVKPVTITKPKGVSGVKLKKGKKAFTVTFKKVSAADGYEIRYSHKKSMKSAKTKSVKTNKATIKKLKAGKTYYVQVRAYKLDGNAKKVTGSWSKAKKIKI